MRLQSHTIMREEVEKAVEVLRRGGIILYPTDTVWGIGCPDIRTETFLQQEGDDRPHGEH